MSNEITRREFMKAAAGVGLAGVALAAEMIAPKEAKASSLITLNYDESNGDANADGQQKMVAEYLREVMGKGTNATEQDLITAIQGIQKEAANAGAATYVDQESIDFRTLEPNSTWVVWISNRNNIIKAPADIQLPFGMPGVTFPKLQGQVAIVHAFDPRVPDRDIATFACKPGIPNNQRLWAVAVR